MMGWPFMCTRDRVRIAAAILTCTLVGLAGNTWTPADQERFLRNANVVDEQPASQGTSKSMKARLSDGRQTHYAHIQQIDIYQPLWKGKDGSEERDFKDSWKFNVAAYRLALLL